MLACRTYLRGVSYVRTAHLKCTVVNTTTFAALENCLPAANIFDLLLTMPILAGNIRSCTWARHFRCSRLREFRGIVDSSSTPSALTLFCSTTAAATSLPSDKHPRCYRCDTRVQICRHKNVASGTEDGSLAREGEIKCAEAPWSLWGNT